MKKRLLITGGTGFLGRHLALSLRSEFAVLLGGRNNNQNSIASEATGCPVLPLDVTNIESVRDVFSEARPEIVIHAAATKYVDLSERMPMECIDVNVLGSQNVARVAIEKNSAMVVGVSTDKATPPTRTAYGLSKALMERMLCGLDGKTETKFACVRFGNLAWSTGSVLPIWEKMQDETGVIRSAGPEMRRFFLPVDGAVALIRTAIDQIASVQGKVLTRRMKAAQIKDLLKVWTEHRGGRWERIPARPGDQDDQFLIGDIELPYTQTTVYGGIDHYVVSFTERADNPARTAISSANAERLSAAEMLDLINSRAD
jgi:UDP-N-acetylglucosamine 4,6-dehydratase